MGAKMVLKWTSKTPNTEQQAYEPLCKAAELLRGTKRQHHYVECSVTEAPQYVASSGRAKQTLSQIRFSDDDEHIYLILNIAGQVISASTSLTGRGGVLEKLGMQPASTGNRRGIRFEGMKYVLGDFALFVAQATNMSGSKDFMGIVAEVEYMPLHSLTAAQPVLNDFVGILSNAFRKMEGAPEGVLQKLPLVYPQFKLSDKFTAQHSAVQVLSLCKAVAKLDLNYHTAVHSQRSTFMHSLGVISLVSLAAIFFSGAKNLTAARQFGGTDSKLNLRPSIGILTQPGPPAPKNHSYIAASYVKFVEASGGRVVPIEYDLTPEEVKDRFKVINGVLIPGGGAILSPHHPFFDTASHLLELTLAANDAGDYFPLHGTCLGFEALSVILSKNTSILSQFDSDNNASPLILTAEAHNSRFFNSMHPDVLANLQSQSLAMENHNFGITYDAYTANSGLQSFFAVTSLSVDRTGAPYVSTMESRKYPLTATQWHPEKNAFEWATSLKIPHSPEAIEVTHAVSNFFLNEARRNFHSPANVTEENSLLIYNYVLEFTGKATYEGIETGFDECYIFPERGGRQHAVQ